MMKLSLITINYNSSESTIRLLKSLSEQTDKNFETIVIDNASGEADFNDLKQSAGGVNLIRNDRNLGFSGGNNIGIKKALKTGSEWVLLLNNDTLVEKDFISSIKPQLGQLEGIAGLPLDEGWRTCYAGRVKWLKYPRSFNIDNFELAKKYGNIFIIGGGMLIHKTVFEKIGFLDEKYFLYFEDIDYSVRARNNGIPLNILEYPIIHHSVSLSAKKLGRPLLLRYHYRNALYFNLKNGPGHIKFLIWPWSLMIIVKQSFKIMLMYKQNESLAILLGVFDFYRNKMGKIKTGISQ